MPVDHYENFPVASIFLPARFRRPVELIYRFARTADDFADEGDVAPTERLQQLDTFRTQLHRIEHGLAPTIPWFVELASVVREYGLPLQLFQDLLSAFSQDVARNCYQNFDDVLDYCTRSANPIGRLLLILYGAATAENIRWSDAICSALQLINCLQDIAIDWRKGRVYLPMDEVARYGVTVDQISAGQTSDAWRALMAFQVSRARTMLLSGKPLGRHLPGRFGLEIRMIICGGNRILTRIEQARGDVFRRRPVLRWYDWPSLVVRSL